MCKRLLVLFIFLGAMMRTEAQQLNYQAIARNANGVALTFRDVGIRLSIRDGSQTGSIVYSETRNVRTNQFGLFTVVIGSPGASNVLGSMASINWISGNKYLQVEIDPEGGNNYFQAGTSQLQAVPYALFANAAYPVGPAGGDLLGSTYPNPIIAPLAVTTGKLANQAVTTPKIADLNVTTAKLADQAITNPKIQDNTIANIKLVNSKVTLNGLILNLGDSQDFAVGTNGTDVNIISAGKTHTFNFPDASIANRGLITPNAQTIGGNKTFNNDITAARIIRAGGIAAQFLKADGSVDNNTYLTANQPIIVTATGDATGVSTSSGTAPVLPLTLATVNSAVGTFGNNITIPSITVNNKGLITDVIANPIPIATATTSGLLTVGDWNTFNNKQNAIPLGISAQYFRGDLSLGNFTNDVRSQLSAGTNITYANGNIGLTNNSVTINALPLALGGSQSFATGSTGNDFNISSAGTVHSFNIPSASATSRGLLTSADFSNFNAAYTSRITGLTTTGSSGPATLSGNVLNIPNYTLAGLGGISSSTTLNGLSLSSNQTFSSGNIGTDFNIVSSGTNHAFNFPTASASARGLLSSSDWSTFNNKQATINGIGYGKWNGSTISFNNQIPLGSDVSGTLLPANFGQLTGDVTNTSGSYTTTIANNAITTAKIADGAVSNNKLINKSITINGLPVELGSSQTLLAGSGGTDFYISSTGSTHTFNLPSASASARGLLTSADWSAFNNKQASISGTGYSKWSGSTPSFNSTIPLGTDVSGTLLAANFGQLTGDVTNAPGSYATTIANDAITTTKIADGAVSNAKLTNKSITINGLAVDLGSSQSLLAGSGGNDFNISSIGSTHTFNLPSASATARGLLTNADWSTFNNKQAAISGTGYSKWSGSTPSFNSTIPLGTDVSGTLLAANFGQLTGDVTNAPGSYATTIANDAITTTKIADGAVSNAKLTNKSITINGLTVDLGSSQSLLAGSGGTDFNISSIGSSHTFNLPSASATARGLLTSADWSTFNNKQASISGTGYSKWSGSTPSFNSTIPLGTDVSGTLLAANFGQLTGDVTNAPGSYTTTIANDAITTSKIADGTVSNAKLTSNGSFTLGSTSISLGTTTSTVAGLTLTSPTINSPAIYYTNTPTGLTAGANSQGSINLTNDINIVTTAAASSAVTLPVAQAGRQVTIINRGANPINVYPASSAQINSLAVNAAFSSVPANSYAEFYATSSSQWYSANSIATSTSSWDILGNYGLSAGTNYLGTNDNTALQFKVNNKFSGQIHPTATVGNTSFGFETNSTTNSNSYTTAFGSQALKVNNNSGLRNSAFGALALTSNNSGLDNTGIGQGALSANLSGDNNTGIGQGALTFNSTGTSNTAVGQAALNSNTTTSNNTAVGKSALFANGGSNNTGIGHFALIANTTGNANTAVGQNSLSANTTTSNNTAVGWEALRSTTNNGNVGIGFRADVTTSAQEAVAVGINATVTGNNSVAIGRNSSASNINGIVIGNTASANSLNSISIGSPATTTNVYTIAIGDNTTSSGENGIAIGKNATASQQNSVAIGSDATNNTINSVLIGGTSNVLVNATGALTATGSITAGGRINGTGAKFAFYETTGSAYPITINDYYIKVNTNITVTLPSAVGIAGQRFVIYNATGAVYSSIATTSGQSITGASWTGGLAIAASLKVFSDGANWLAE